MLEITSGAVSDASDNVEISIALAGPEKSYRGQDKVVEIKGARWVTNNFLFEATR